MTRTLDARIEVLRDGIPITQLRFVDPPLINASKKTKIKTSMSGTFEFNPTYEPLSDELRPVITIDGVEHFYGIYSAGTVRDEFENGTHFIAIEAYDRGYILSQTKIESIYTVAAGTNYVEAVDTLLAAVGIALVLKTPTNKTLPSALEWVTGTDYLTMINQLLDAINYNQIWFNTGGEAVIEPYTAPDVANVKHTYDGTTPLSVLREDATSEIDMYNTPNVFICVVSNPDRTAALSATAINDNPLSKLSTISRGRRIASVVNVDDIADQETLQAYANKLRDDATLSSETISIGTAIMPNHGIGNIVVIKHPSISGVFEETKWAMQLKAGNYMTHELRRVVLI